MLHLPTPDTTAKLLASLLGRPVKVGAGKVDDAKLTIAGTYRSGDIANAAACLMDAGFGAYAGAALSLLPVAVAAGYVKKGRLEEDILDNCGEVLNVCSRLFTSDDQHRVTLDTRHFAPEPLPPAAAALLAGGKRLDLVLDIDKYGSGMLVLAVPG